MTPEAASRHTPRVATASHALKSRRRNRTQTHTTLNSHHLTNERGKTQGEGLNTLLSSPPGGCAQGSSDLKSHPHVQQFQLSCVLTSPPDITSRRCRTALAQAAQLTAHRPVPSDRKHPKRNGDIALQECKVPQNALRKPRSAVVSTSHVTRRPTPVVGRGPSLAHGITGIC